MEIETMLVKVLAEHNATKGRIQIWQKEISSVSS
jgi:hypothetical protein